MKTSFFTLLFLVFNFIALGTEIDSIQQPGLWLEQQNIIGQELLDQTKFSEAAHLFKAAHLFAVDKNLSNQFNKISIGYGIAMYNNGDIQNAQKVLLSTLPKIDESDLDHRGEVSQILGMTFIFQDKFPEGYRYQMDAFDYYSKLNDSTRLMKLYYDIGSNFDSQGQTELAKKNYEKGIELARAVNDVKMTIFGLTAIGGTYASMNDYDKALTYSKEGIDLAKEINDVEEIAWASINRGHILCKLNRFDESEIFLRKSYDLSFVIGNKLLTAYSLEQLSDINIQRNKLTQAIKDLDESYKLFKELGQVNSIKGVTKKYAEIYYKKKDFVKYKEYTDKYIAIKDSLYSSEFMESMASLKQDFEIQKIERENQITLLTKDKELSQAKGKIFIITICGAIIVFLLIVFLLYSRNRAARDKYNLLTAKNAEILRQNKRLVSSNNDLEKFAYIISHDLKEPLRNINGFTNLLVRKLKKYAEDQDIKEYATFITNGTHQMGELLNGILEYSKAGVNKAEKEICDLNEIVTNVIDGFKIKIDEKQCNVKIEELPKVVCRSTPITQVFQNLIANAIKFSPDSGNEISVSVEDLGEKYKFLISDNGIGIDHEYQKDIFIVFKRLHDRGTYKGSGIGLSTCKKIIEDHGGRIGVISNKGEGATFYFTLPKEPILDMIASPVTNILEDLVEQETA